MLDFKEIPPDGEVWEQFAEEFLSTLGLTTDSPPDRGADGGKDLLMTETIKGPVHTESFRWLISCKHTATSGVSISETTHEKNILERVKAFKADGFLGFYSTLPSSGLNSRLRDLRDNDEFKAYKVFSGKLIENELLALGRSWLIRRYFPESYKTIRPLHQVFDQFVELKCDSCGKDLLKNLFDEGFNSLIAKVVNRDEKKTIAVYFACKGACDKMLQKNALDRHGALASWEDISDLAMPNQFVRCIMVLLNQMRAGHTYEDAAFEKEKQFIMAMSQKVMREVSDAEKERLRDLMHFRG